MLRQKIITFHKVEYNNEKELNLFNFIKLFYFNKSIFLICLIFGLVIFNSIFFFKKQEFVSNTLIKTVFNSHGVNNILILLDLRYELDNLSNFNSWKKINDSSTLEFEDISSFENSNNYRLLKDEDDLAIQFEELDNFNVKVTIKSDNHLKIFQIYNYIVYSSNQISKKYSDIYNFESDIINTERELELLNIDYLTKPLAKLNKKNIFAFSTSMSLFVSCLIIMFLNKYFIYRDS